MHSINVDCWAELQNASPIWYSNAARHSSLPEMHSHMGMQGHMSMHSLTGIPKLASLKADLIIRVVGVIHEEHLVDRHLVCQLIQHHELQHTTARLLMLFERGT